MTFKDTAKEILEDMLGVDLHESCGNECAHKEQFQEGLTALEEIHQQELVEAVRLVTQDPPSIESLHDFPAKSKDFRPWKNEYGNYEDWSHVPDELYKCKRCGVDWGKAIRSNIRECVAELNNLRGRKGRRE